MIFKFLLLLLIAQVIYCQDRYQYQGGYQGGFQQPNRGYPEQGGFQQPHRGYPEQGNFLQGVVILQNHDQGKKQQRDRWQVKDNDWFFERLTSNRVLWREITSFGKVYNLFELSENDKSIVLGDEHDKKKCTRTVIINNDKDATMNFDSYKMESGYLVDEGFGLNVGSFEVYGGTLHNVVKIKFIKVHQNRSATGLFYLPGGWVNFNYK